MPMPALNALYYDLCRGGVRLIIGDHVLVDPSGGVNPEMRRISADNLILRFAGQVAVLH